MDDDGWTIVRRKKGRAAGKRDSSQSQNKESGGDGGRKKARGLTPFREVSAKEDHLAIAQKLESSMYGKRARWFHHLKMVS